MFWKEKENHGIFLDHCKKRMTYYFDVPGYFIMDDVFYLFFLSHWKDDLRTLPVVDGVRGCVRMSPFLLDCKHKTFSLQ